MIAKPKSIITVPMSRALADKFAMQDEPGYWLEFDEDPGVRKGGHVMLEVDHKIIGLVLVDRVSRNKRSKRWVVEWEGMAFEFVN